MVTPALAGSRASHWASDIDEAIELARQRMELSLIAISAVGPEGEGEIGDSDPNVAIEDALRVFPADEIVISTHPPERSRWLEHGVVERAREEIDCRSPTWSSTSAPTPRFRDGLASDPANSGVDTKRSVF